MATETGVLSVMRYLAAAYPRREIDEKTVAVYVMQLLRSQLEAEVLLLAAMNLIDASEWLPTVAELTAEARRIESERAVWYLTTNYRLHGEPLPDRLRLPPLPPDLLGPVLGYELNGWQSGALELEAIHEQE